MAGGRLLFALRFDEFAVSRDRATHRAAAAATVSCCSRLFALWT